MSHNPLEGPSPEMTIKLSDGTQERISIVIVHRDRPAYLNLCVQSIAVTSVNNNYEIIIVDNNSGPETQAFLDELENSGQDIKVVRNKENIYYGPAINKGVEVADPASKYFIFMHSDVIILHPSWMDILVGATQTSGAEFVGPELGVYEIFGQRINFVQDWILLVTRECWRDIGPYDPRLPLLGGSFLLTLKARKAGYSPQYIRNQIAHHCKIFGVDVSEWEALTQDAKTLLPICVKEIQDSVG